MKAFYRTWGGYIRVTGEDRHDWLDRQSTNNMRALTPTRAVRTVLTSPTGRILDVLTVLDEGEALGLVPLPGYVNRTLHYLRGRIFFMDKVKVTDATSEVGLCLCEGPQVEMVAGPLGVERLPALDEVLQVEMEGAPVRAVGTSGVGGDACLLVVPREHMAAVEERLQGAGILPIDEATYEVLRVEAGIPGPGRELTTAYTPLEVGLEDLIAEGKCYPGQEVIARQITYDKVVRRLVKLRLDAAVEPGAEVVANGKPVGVVTSAAVSPRKGPLALAVLRRPYFEKGTRVAVRFADATVEGVVA